MPLTQSNDIALGTPAVEFNLPDGEGKLHGLASFVDHQVLVVAFISNRCPFVLHIRTALADVVKDYQTKGVGFVAINSNDQSHYPEEALEHLAAEAQFYGFTYLRDAEQVVAQAFGAACTPDFYVFDGERRLVYHGQFDSSRPKNERQADGADLRAALDAVLSGQGPLARQMPAIGCNIKWLAGNEPEAFVAAS